MAGCETMKHETQRSVMERSEAGNLRQQMLERSVLASVIAGDALPSALSLTAGHFTDPLTRRLFSLMARMEQNRQEIDLTNVCMADETIDPGLVVELAKERCVSEVIVRQNCTLLRETAMRRRLDAMLAAARDALTSGGDAMGTLSGLSDGLAGMLRETGGEQAAGRTMLELICDVVMQIEKNDEPPAPPIACGIEKLDQCLSGGFRNGDLAVVAALTSVGKSAMLSFMMRNAAEQGKKILLISCEMSDTQNAERFLASISGIDVGKLMRRETLTDEENQSLVDGMTVYHPENIRVISSGTQTVASIRREALRMKLSEGLDMIVVDYLQRLRPESGRGANRADDVGGIASGLKSLAVDLDVPVLTAAQFNREAARARNDARGKSEMGVPALHQLRDSSQIEDEANTVIILDEPSRDDSLPYRRIKAVVSKNRSGGTGAIWLRFIPKRMIFEPWEKRG